MGKKVKEYKSGDFIFAKVKGYPAWPARVQKLNGKKYFVYFYGTGETANLPANMIFDYAENKDKFLTKSVKRRDFNDGVKQIEHDFVNNVPLEQVIGAGAELPPESSANDTANDTAADDTMDDSAIDTTGDDTAAETTNTTAQNDAAVEDSDDAGALVIDEGKQKAKKSKEPAKTPAKETPAKAAKTPRGKAKKEESKEKEEEDEKKDDEIISRSGRKIRPKRYIDEQTEENTTLPSPAPKKRRGTSPAADKDKEKEKTDSVKEKPADKNVKQFNAVQLSELEDLKEPFKPADADKDNILIAYLPTGQYVGVKLFQSRPNSFKNEASRLQWDKQAASNAITLKMQLEKGHITPQSVIAQLVMDLNLTDEEKATLDKERETEEKRSRVQFLKTEMKLIELDAKIKTCVSLEKADTDLCIKLLDELVELDVKPLMLLKHPTCLETVKRMRAYVGNAPSWDLSESDVLQFSKQAHRIRKMADTLYKNMMDLFSTPDGLQFWEYFSERVQQFKKATVKLNADELLEMVHEPLEMTVPTANTMSAAIEAANEEDKVKEDKEEEEPVQKKKGAPAKTKKDKPATPSKPPLKRQSSRKQVQEEKEKEDKPEENNEQTEETDKATVTTPEKEASNDETAEMETETTKEPETTENNKSKTPEPMETEPESNKDDEKEDAQEEAEKKKDSNDDKSPKEDENSKEGGKKKEDAKSDKSEKSEKSSKEKSKDDKVKETDKEKKEKEKEKEEEPRAKRSRAENKKTEPPPSRSSASKRKSKP